MRVVGAAIAASLLAAAACACGGRTALATASPVVADTVDAGTPRLDATPDAPATGPSPTLGAGRTLDCAAFAGVVSCWGYLGALGSPAGLVPHPTVVGGLPPVTQLAGGQDVTCALALGGDVLCWGVSWCGSLAFDDPASSGATVLFPPRPIPGGRFSKVSYTGQWGCAITDSSEVACWGGSSGGIATSGGQALCVAPPRRITGLSAIIDVAVGIDHACAVRSDGVVLCWGSDYYGQVGNSYYTGCHDPDLCQEPVSEVLGVTAASAVVAGERHSCALVRGGRVACWGRNDSGQLGNGAVDTSIHPTPESVTLPQVTQLSASVDDTCARTVDGDAYCWGSNGSGQIGNGMQGGSAASPSRVPLEHVDLVVASFNHACALDASGRVFCWGDEDSIDPPSLVPVLRASGQ